MKRVLIAALMLGVLFQGSGGIALAQKAAPPYMVYGPVRGNVTVSCGSFVSSTSPQREVYEWWFAGFVTGAGHVLSGYGTPLAITDAEGINKWVAK